MGSDGCRNCFAECFDIPFKEIKFEEIQKKRHAIKKEVKIEIEDKGVGIPEDERHRIFDMFYTMERGDRGKFGTGLGLTIVKAIIGAHMGTIEAFSGRQNKGTLIQIKLPLRPVKE